MKTSSRAADGGLCAELLQNGDFEYNGEKKGWNATTAWMGVELSPSTGDKNAPARISTENGVSKNNSHFVMVSSTPIYNIGWEGIPIKRGAAYNVGAVCPMCRWKEKAAYRGACR